MVRLNNYTKYGRTDHYPKGLVVLRAFPAQCALNLMTVCRKVRPSSFNKVKLIF
jgi:hypothetical protein